MILLENSAHFMLWHDPTGGCLYATWQGKHPSWSTQVQYLLIQQHLGATGSTKLLNDSLLDEDGWSEAAGWVAEHGFRYLAEAGLQAVAWVLPRQPAAFYDTARVLAQLHQPLVDTFTEAQAAYDWLHRWPAVRSVTTAGGAVGSAAAFRLLPLAQQVTLAAQQGRALVSRWEAAYYVQPLRASQWAASGRFLPRAFGGGVSGAGAPATLGQTPGEDYLLRRPSYQTDERARRGVAERNMRYWLLAGYTCLCLLQDTSLSL